MWQDILVYSIVGLVAALVAWRFYKTITGRTQGCGGCPSSRSCGAGGANGEDLRPLSGCGCGR
ncbi:MAG: hypothetical protein KKA55_13210 [Proteobacteria bacterium]|nr:hypothetical protein [Pseudomonadota bacterium]MBU1596476.1 hypothetical protein [Pseudomonadota bacterium]